MSKQVQKKEIKGAYTITVTGEQGEKTAQLKEVSNATFYKVFPLISPILGSSPKILEGGEIILRECFIGGDKEILTVEEYILGASIQCVSLIKVADSTIKKN